MDLWLKQICVELFNLGFTVILHLYHRVHFPESGHVDIIDLR